MEPEPPNPRCWVLSGPKSGDRTQMLALAEALAAGYGVSWQEKSLKFGRWELLLHLWPRPTLAGLTDAVSAGLTPPWPDLVITAGRRNELVALWIKQRSAKTRVVHLGRPWCNPARFDRVISTEQYGLRPGPNVSVNPMPLHRVDTQRLVQAASDWQARFSKIPRPWTVLLVGGDSGPFVFSNAQAERLARRTNRLRESDGGGILVSTSARTPPGFAARLESLLERPVSFYRWESDQPNPYLAYLALGDRFVVTADSMSMVSEAVDTGRPVYLFAIEPTGNRPWWLRSESYRWKPLSHRIAMMLAPTRMRRDITKVMGRLVQSGRASWLDETPAVFQPRPADADQRLEDAARQVFALLDNAGQSRP
ncbi:MAG: ELM1/GtrOC1 family putative glycosyltransferase [Gammaproteobacteria bacterium]